MADGGTLQRLNSYSEASADADEAFCGPCHNDGKWTAVEGYCSTCEEYFCAACLRVHRNQKLTRRHTILDKNQMSSRLRSVNNQDLCVEVCKTHHPEIVRYYCKVHDVPGCVDCMTLNHATCNKDHIQDVSGGFQATKEFKKIKKNLEKFHEKLEEMEDELDNGMKNLVLVYDEIQQKITTFRQQINDYLDQIQKQITDESNNMKKRQEKEMKKLIAHNESMKSEIEVILQKMQTESNINENSTFIFTKQAKQRLVTLETAVKKMEQSLQQQKYYVFRRSIEINNLVSANTPLGKLLRKPNINTTASYRGDINVKTKAEKEDSFITGSTLLSPDRMVVTDANNCSVRLINLSNNKVLSRYGTPSIPSRVTTVSEDQVAITLPDEKKIQVLIVTSTFTKQHEIKVHNACYGIAYKDGQFAVSYTNPGRVDIVDMYGNLLHKIQPHHNKRHILQFPMYVTFGHHKDTVIVSDSGINTGTVHVVKFSGEVFHTYLHETLKEPYGIVMTPDGVLFICSRMNGCIHAVSRDFKTSNVIIFDDNVRTPRAVTYCDINHRLYISNYNFNVDDMSNNIQVYDLAI